MIMYYRPGISEVFASEFTGENDVDVPDTAVKEKQTGDQTSHGKRKKRVKYITASKQANIMPSTYDLPRN